MYLYLLFEIKIIGNNIISIYINTNITIIISIAQRSNKLIYYFHNFNNDSSYYVIM